MRTRLVDIAIVALATITLAACTDEHRDFLAPHTPDKLLSLPVGPIPLPSPYDFEEIGAGSSYNCAMQRDGDVWCWGMYQSGPIKVFSGAAHIAVGDAHACALNSAGAAFCWGMDNDGQVGWETAYDFAFEPVKAVAGPVDKNNPYGPLLPALTFTSIAAGGNSTCGTTSAGVFCWGDQGAFPQITSPGTGVPSLITSPAGNPFPNNGFTSLAVGKYHTCGLGFSTINCWGLNTQFQTGVEPTWTFALTQNSLTGAMDVATFYWGNHFPQTVSRISAQGALTCVDLSNKTVECIGNNDNAELGNGVGPSTFLPQPVGGGLQLWHVSAGLQHACALDVNNHAVCWGSDGHGELGNGLAVGTYTTVQSVAVVSINMVSGTFSATPMTFRALASGAEHTCGIGTDNHIYCWGDNRSRELGRDVFTASGATATFTVNPVQTM